jgi:multidrug resistance protein, MATE family
LHAKKIDYLFEEIITMIRRWSQPNGYRQVLNISLPLVASMGTLTLMQFTDRIFLANHSINAISAALPAGLASFTFISFFMAVANYTNAFVAQYTGARAFSRVGLAVWQGIYFALISAVLLSLFFFIAEPLFDVIGHAPAIRSLEIVYFKILILGSGLVVVGSALACFYTGRGLTWTIMFVHLGGAVVNIPLDYCLINGVGPFPQLGIVGAGIATVTAYMIIVIILCLLFLSPFNRRRFSTWQNRRFDPDLFRRLMVYGFPSGVQLFLEIFGFTFFIQMTGRIGNFELATSNIVFTIQSLVFIPMVGFHIGNSTLVGQAIGRGVPADGEYATTSVLHLAMIYMGLLVLSFLLFPHPLLNLFQSDFNGSGQPTEVLILGTNLLRFVCIYCFFDALNLVYSGAIKGAGDTRFCMWMVAALLVGVMILPVFIAVEVFHVGIYAAWVLATFFACSLGITFFLRYRSGKWKTMQVIESHSARKNT